MSFPLTSRYLVYQESIPPTWRGPARTGSGDVAEADAAGLGCAEFDVGDLVRRHQDLAALAHSERENGMAVAGQRAGQLALDFIRRGVGLDHEFAWHRLNSDLDFHGAP